MEKLVGEGVKFERIRRVTGYLSGDVSRFNNGKRAEEKDRVNILVLKTSRMIKELTRNVKILKKKKQKKLKKVINDEN